MCQAVYKKIFKIFSLLLICSNTYAQNYEFNNLVIFGDSLSDVGNLFANTSKGISNSKIIAGNNKVYNEYLSLIFTGKVILPSAKGGTNYAISNATVEWAETSIYGQFYKYLENHRIIPNNLYIIWGGGNDLAEDVFDFVTLTRLLNIGLQNSIINTWNFIASGINNTINNEFKPIENIDYEKNYIITYADVVIYYMSKVLINQGARYIIVPNLFDAGVAPIFILPEKILSIGAQNILDANPNHKNLSLQKILLPFGLNKLIYNTINQILAIKSQSHFKHLNKQNNIPLAGQTGREFILNNLHNRYSKLGLGNLAVKLADLFSFVTRSFNYFVDEALSTLDNKIVYVDIYHLFNEIIDNPTLYGFYDILLPTCNTIFDSVDLACKNQLSGVYHSEKDYLWSDSVHPSPLMHMIYAQYIQSIFNAPLKLSAIPQQLITDNNNIQDYLFNQLDNFNPTKGQTFSFVSFGGNLYKLGNYYDTKKTYSNNLNLGIAYALDNNLILGSMLNTSFGKLHPFDTFKYSFHSHTLIIFSKYYFNNNNFSVITNFSLGRLNAYDISRIINLGKAKFIEKSNTHAKSLGFNFAINYDLLLNDNITLSPYINFNLHNYKTNPIIEYSNNSTAMKFGKSSTTDKNIKLAIKITKQFNPKNISFLELGIKSPVDNHPISINSSLKNVKSSFNREIFFNDKTSFNYSLGFKHLFHNNISLNSFFNYKFNHHHNNQLNYAIGINAKF